MKDTLIAVLAARVREHPERVALRELAAGGAPSDRAVTWSEWARSARCVAAALVADGIAPGARVAVLAGNRLLWPIADLGILSAGLVSVGVYPTSSAGQLRDLLSDCGASVVLVDTAEQLAKLGTALELSPAALRPVLVVHDAPGAAVPPACAHARVLSWAQLLARGATLLSSDPAIDAAVERRLAAVRPDDDAVLMYTSGSTGTPKAARLSHRYLLASAESVRDTLGLGDADSSLSYLPFSHAAERVFGLATRVLCGMPAGLVADHARVWDAARAFAPTLFGGVPRYFEKLYEALITAEAAEGEAFSAALALGRERASYLRAGRPVPTELAVAYEAADAPLAAWRASWLGGAVRLVTSGGAALPPEVAGALEAAGVVVLGAYGMTEHLCVAFHRPDDYAFDSVGRPMPGTELDIADDGEVLVRRGALTFSGYFGRDDESAEAFTPDGVWLRTGDLGTIDADGRLRITGRKKELIALSAGKKIVPTPIESRLVAQPWIAQAMCYGEGRRFVSALLTLRRPVVEQWARDTGIEAEFAQLLEHPELLAQVQRMVDQVNAGLSSPERIKRFALLDRELSVDAGELTETQKLRRPVVAERYRHRLDALYD